MTMFGVRALPLQEVGTSPEPTIGSKGHSLFNLPGDAHLPPVAEHVYNDLVQGGHPPGGETYRLALGIMMNWAHGRGVKNKATIAKAQAGVAQWEKLKAEAHAHSAAKKVAGAVKEDVAADSDDLTDEEHALVAALTAEEKAEILASQPSDYLQAVIAAQNEGRNVQEGRLAEDWGSYDARRKISPGGWSQIQVGEGPATKPGRGRKIMATVSKRVFEFHPAPIDAGHPTLKKGDRVRIAKLHGAPAPGTMGHYHIAHPETGAMLGMVSGGSLRPAGKVQEAFDGKKAPPFEKGGGRGGDSMKWTGEHKGGGGSPFGKGSGKCPVCGNPISEHDLGGRLKKPKVEEAELSSAERDKLPKSAFVFPADRRYPIHDLAHAKNALARCSGKPEEAKVKAAVRAKYPKLKEELSEEWSPAALAARKAKHPNWDWGKTTPGDFSHLGTKIPEGSRMAAPKSPAAEAEATYKHHLSFTKALRDGHQYGGSVASQHAVVRFGGNYHLVHTETMMDAHHRDGMPIEKAVEHASLGKVDSPEKAAHMMAAVEHGGVPKEASGAKKDYHVTQNVGKARHVINFHDGVKTHKDGSPFYDVHIASNKRDRDAFVAGLRRKGYVERGSR